MKMGIKSMHLYSAVFFSLLISFLHSQQIDFSVCGKTRNCMTIPEGCTSTSSCEAIVLYVYDKKNNSFTIDLATKNNWIAFAQKPTNSGGTDMSKIRGQYCARTSPVSMGNLHGNNITSYGTPQWQDMVDGVTILSTENKDGIIVCRFTKVPVPPSTSTDWLYNFNTTSLRNVIAYGSGLNGNRPSRHDSGHYARSVDAVRFFDIQTNVAASTTTKPISETAIDFSVCGKTRNCMTIPEGCTSTSSCEAIVLYVYDKKNNSFTIDLATKNNWIAFAQKPTNSGGTDMSKIRGQYCARTSPVSMGNLHGNNITSYGTPQWQDMVDGVTILSTENKDGIIVCRFTKVPVPPSTSTDWLYNFNTTSLRNVIAYGSGLNGNRPSRHDSGHYARSVDAVRFFDIQTNVAASTTTKPISETAIDFSVCGKTRNCMTIPEGCTSTSSCEAIVLYVYDKKNNSFTIDLATKNNWIAFAQKPTNSGGTDMSKIRGQYCARTSPVSMGNLHGNNITSYGTPQWQDMVDGVTILSTENKDGIIVCRFTKVPVPPSTSTDWLYNFNTTSLRNVIAYGSGLNGNRPSRHDSGHYARSVDAVRFFDIQTNVAASTTTKPISETAIDFSVCGKTRNCMTIPEGCTSTSSCEAIVLYVYDKKNNSFTIDLATKNNWIAFAQKPTNSGGTDMSKIRGQYCARTSPVSMGNLHGNNITSYGTPQWQDMVDGVTILSTENKDGIIVCRFTKVPVPPSTSTDWLYNFNTTSLRNVIAYGSGLNGNRPSRHDSGHYARSVDAVRFFDIQTNVAASTTTKPISETAIDFSVCGKTRNCMTIPEGCTSTSSCEAIVLYVYDKKNNSFTIDLATKNNWIAFAQKPTNSGGTDMSKIRGQYCARTSPVSMGNLHGNNITSYGTPQWQDMVDGVTILSTENKDGIIVCRFTKVPVPPSTSTDWLYNFNTTSLRNVIAYGSTFNGNRPSKHDSSHYARSVDAVRFFDIQTNVAVSTTTKPISETAIDFSVCGKTRNCMTIPEGCTSTSSCEAIVLYVYDKKNNSFTIDLATKNNWIAFAQKPTNSGGTDMSKIRGQYCARTSPVSMGNLHGNDITTYGSPQWQDMVDGVTILSTENKDGIIVCRFTKVVVPPSTSTDWLYNFNTTSLRSVIAYGSGLSGIRPLRHGAGHYAKTINAVNYFAIGTVSLSDLRSAEYKEIVHGVLMIIAWVLCATTGICMSRYMKGATKDKKIFGKDGWFTVHVSLMLICVSCFVVGFIIIIVLHKKINASNKHHMLGIFTIIGGLIQPLMALFRPSPDHHYRFIFNWAHRTVGVLSWILGGCSIIFAMRIFRTDETPMIVFMVLVAILFVIFDIVLMFSRGESEDKTASFSGKSNSVDISLPEIRKKKTAVGEWIFFLLILSLAIGFTIYHLYIVVTLS